MTTRVEAPTAVVLARLAATHSYGYEKQPVMRQFEEMLAHRYIDGAGTRAELARRWGLSTERARQIEARLLRALRHPEVRAQANFYEGPNLDRLRLAVYGEQAEVLRGR